MSTQQMQLLHPNHKQLNQLTLVILVIVSSLLMGLVPLIYGLDSTNTQEENFIIPTEAELWSSVGEAIE